jgi:catechol 2,3-dioxygenase-like lactoylglutathione lyase family enzyme
MSTADDQTSVDQKLEVVIIAVSDVDRAKAFYLSLGWRLDATPPAVVQFTPPGSWCSVQFGSALTTAAPGSGKGYLIVSDIGAAREQLAAAGVEVSEVHGGRAGRHGTAHLTGRGRSAAGQGGLRWCAAGWRWPARCR